MSQSIHRLKARGLWSVVMAVIFVGHLSGCGSDSAGTKSANGPVDRTAESSPIRNHAQGEATTIGIDQVSAAAPAPEEPVRATMKFRPESLSAGEAAELLVSVRIAPAHYVHAVNNPGEPWVPMAMNVSLPDGVEFAEDCNCRRPKKGTVMPLCTAIRSCCDARCALVRSLPRETYAFPENSATRRARTNSAGPRARWYCPRPFRSERGRNGRAPTSWRI